MMYFTACMMNVTYQEGDCIYNERKKEGFDEGADSEAARRMGDAADPIFTRHGQGGPVIWHIPLFLGWLFLYLAVNPVTLALKKKQIKPYQKWMCYYGFPACCFLMIPLFHKPPLIWVGVSLLPLFLIHMHFARRKNERALLNDVAGVLFFCSGGLASCWLGMGTLDGWAWFIFLQSALFFIGSSFYVKSVIRERKNRAFAYWSWGYHLLLPFYPLFSEQDGRFSLLSQAACGHGFFMAGIGL